MNGKVDPLKDVEIIETELLLSDIDTLERRKSKLQKQIKSGDRKDKASLETLEKLIQHCSNGKRAEKYEIESVAGRNYKFQNDRAACYKEMEKIFDDIKASFPKSEFSKGKEKAHEADKSGKSVGKVYSIFLNNGRLSVTCTDWSEKITEEFYREDSLKVAIHKKEYMDWINSEAY